MNKVNQGIEFVETNSFEELSKKSAEVMVDCVLKKPESLFCIATGSSPSRAYEIFVELVNKRQINVQELRILKLDEWWKVNANDLSTCENFIQTKIIKPLNISSQNYISFDSETSDADAECSRISKIIQEQGPIDLCILGMGKNGHLGLNEPGVSLIPFSHVVKLDKKTKTHDMLKKTNVTINYGMTIGIADIIASKKVLFLVTGDEKNASFNIFLNREVRADLPASILWLHPNSLCIFDGKLI